MSHRIQLAYSAVATGVTPAALQAAMAAVLLYTSPTQDEVLGRFFGLTVEADVTAVTIGNTVMRTLTLNMDSASGAPFAPPFFTVHPQAVDGGAAIFSTSSEDAALVSVPTAGPCLPGCIPEFTIRPGIGAYTVSVSYVDAEGNAGTVLVALNGKLPVPLVLAPGTKGVVRVTDMHIVTAGSLGSSVGQITLSVFTPPCCPIDPESGQSQVDYLQMALGQAIAMMPNSYYSYAMQLHPTFALAPPVGNCPPCDLPPVPAPPLPTPALLIATLTNFFTRTLALALASPVTAATPFLI